MQQNLIEEEHSLNGASLELHIKNINNIRF